MPNPEHFKEILAVALALARQRPTGHAWLNEPAPLPELLPFAILSAGVRAPQQLYTKCIYQMKPNEVSPLPAVKLAQDVESKRFTMAF